jgi:hypothetical protein
VARVGDFCHGSLNEVHRKCGKLNCACAAPGHRGHGPQWNLTRPVSGRTRALHLKPGPELEKARRRSEYKRFRDLVGQVTKVNEAICQARPAVPGEAGRSADVRDAARVTDGGQHEQRGAPAWLNAPHPCPWTCPR